MLLPHLEFVLTSPYIQPNKKHIPKPITKSFLIVKCAQAICPADVAVKSLPRKVEACFSKITKISWIKNTL